MESTSPKMKWLALSVILVVLVAAIVFGVRSINREADNQASASGTPAGQVTISAGTLSPSTIKVQKGQSVIWTNQDDQPHQLSATADGKELEGFDTDDHLQQGESFSYVFDDAGTFYYYDPLNPQTIKGEIVVEE